jgi:hypothetical protein
MFFDENAPAGDWREQVFHCRDNGVSISRDIAFAVAIADLLQLPDDLPLMPAVNAAMSVPTRLSDRESLAHLRAVARAAGRTALADAHKRPDRAKNNPALGRVKLDGGSSYTERSRDLAAF